MKKSLIFFLTAFLAVSWACGSNYDYGPTPTSDLKAPARSFYLGFTPAPYEISEKAIHFIYENIANNADIIAHHFDNGVPWPEALNGEEYPTSVKNDWESRKNRTPGGHQVYLAITPIRLLRNGLADYSSAQGEQPLPPPWDTYAFNHTDVKSAYLNHAIKAVEFFEPDYLAIGIESNLLIDHIPEQWEEYLELHIYVYTQLKTRYPDLPIFATVAGNALLDEYQTEHDTAAHLAALQQILQYSDYYGISFYPHLFKGAEFPPEMFETLFALSDKPIAITETAYPAESLSILGGYIAWESDPDRQKEYFATLLEEADAREMVFIITFFLRDYDILWAQIEDPDMSNLASIWRDTGFFDEDGNPRAVLDLWQKILSRPYQDQ